MTALALQLRAIAARAPMLDRPAIATAADAVEENARLRRDHMAHWCAMDHEPIRHNNSEHEQCPMCRLLNENSALAAGSCIVPGGLVGDEGGTPTCVMRAERDVWKSKAEARGVDACNARAELDATRALATCGCGDEFTTHDPGTCGACMAQNDSGLRIALQKAEAERDALLTLLRECRLWILTVNTEQKVHLSERVDAVLAGKDSP